MSRVFVLEDDVLLGGALMQSLQRAGFIVDWRRCVADAYGVVNTATYAAIVLDLELPDGNGLDLLDRLRRHDDLTPVLILSVRDAIADRVRGLDAGADDYMSKPFAVAELVSRLNALIRRSAGRAQAEWRIGDLYLNPARHSASVEDRELELTPKEYKLLFELMRHAGQVVSRARLEAAVLRSADVIDSNVIEVYIHTLRRKIGAGRIRTVRGVGYQLNP